MPLPIPFPVDSENYKKILEVFEKVLQIAPNAIARVYNDWVGPYAEVKKLKMLGKTNAEMKLLTALTDSEIESRSSYRINKVSIERQNNLEDLVYLASQNIGEINSVEKVNDDWIKRFVGISQDISTHELKNLWAKILAGEIKSPGTFSLRTLDYLKNISSEEAELFTRICKIADLSGKVYSHGAILNSTTYGVQYYQILLLQEAGLVHTGGQGGKVFIRMGLKAGESYVIPFGERSILISAKENYDLDLEFYQFSRAGIEISQLVEKTINNDYITALADWLKGDSRVSAVVATGQTPNSTTKK